MKVSVHHLKKEPWHKVSVKFDKPDFVNLDQTLAFVIWPMLEGYREYAPTIIVMDDDFKAALDEMIFAFKEIATNEAAEVLFKDYMDEDMNMKPGFVEAEEALQRRIEDGLLEFGKRFRALWT